MKFLWIGLFCAIVFPSFGQLDDCDLKRNRDGVKVYTCKSANEKIKSLRAEFVLENTSLEELEMFMLDVENYVTWQYNMTEAKVLKKVSDTEVIYRTEVDAPWPVDNREMIVRLKIDKGTEAKQMNLSITSIPYEHPAKEGVIRVKSSQAAWHVVVNGTSLEVEYTLRIDPGGSIPAWLINMAMAEGPHESFRDLKAQIEKKD